MIGLLLVAFVACTPQPLDLEATPVQGGLDVTSGRPLDRIDLYSAAGALAVTRQLKTPSRRVFLPTPPAGDGFRVVGTSGPLTGGVDVAFPSFGPLTVEVEAPVGQGRQRVAEGENIGLVRFGQEAIDIGVLLTAVVPTTAVVEVGSQRREVALETAGERAYVTLPLDADPSVPLRVRAGGVVLSATLRPSTLTRDQVRARLGVSSLQFPTDAWGQSDRARPPDRVTLPASWWRKGLQSVGLGYRPRDDQAPWGWQAVTLRNDATTDIDVVLRAVVLASDGTRAEAFRSQVRGSDSDAVTTVLRVPAKRSATASLPVFVDGDALSNTEAYQRRIEVLPLGSDRPVEVVEAPLFVQRGSPWASLGFAVALLSSVAGYLLILGRGRKWMKQMQTTQLVTVALFGSLSYVVATALQVVGMGLASVLGPFSPLLMGVVDDAFRACLLGTLVALLPRPGTAMLATLVGFLMRGLTLGAFHPVDLLYVGSTVLWLETWLWVSGCTRGAGWLDGGRIEQWVRLSVGLGVSNVCATATGLAISVVLYRLFLADWYVIAILALPGFLYVVVGAWLAVDFAAALKRVSL
jgi:hypothetical protein